MIDIVFNPLTGRQDDIELVLQMMCSQDGCDGEPYDQMQAASDCIAKLRADNKALRDALEAVEWREDDEGNEVCALCGELKWIGHFSDCKIGNALKKVRGQ